MTTEILKLFRRVHPASLFSRLRAHRRFSVWDSLALLISLATVFYIASVSTNVFENIPHIEDEMAYTWQAETIAGGNLLLPTPTCPKCFLYPFVIDVNGLRTSKYPPGWPVMLSFGVRLGERGLVNPLLAGASIWLIYRLVKKVLDEKTALLAVLLAGTSPLFVMNAGTLLSHTWSLFLTAAFALAWLDTFDPTSRLPRWLTGATAALALGVLALTRPLTALAVALPFTIHGLILLVKGNMTIRKTVLSVGLAVVVISSLHFIWQYTVTGSPWKNPYELWWAYDTIGFGANVGRQAGGYWPKDAIPNLQVSLSYGTFDLFGWAGYSWIFLPFGVLAILRRPRALLVSLLLPSVVLAYCFYWIGSWLTGPRYYYEGLIGAVLLTAAGIRWLAGRLLPATATGFSRNLQRLRFGLVAGVVMFLVASNVLFYLPRRVAGLHGLYNVSRADQLPFVTPSAIALTPALVIVHPQNDWIEYGRLLDLSTPYLNTPFIFTISRGAELDQAVAAQYRGRSIWHYYPQVPYVFYTSPLAQP